MEVSVGQVGGRNILIFVAQMSIPRLHLHIHFLA